MSEHTSILSAIPPAAEVHCRLGRALHEVILLRSLLRLAKHADSIRQEEPQLSGRREKRTCV
jgi:cytochrome b561